MHIKRLTYRDLGEEVLGDAPALPGQTLGNPDLDIKMLRRRHDGPGDHEYVLQTQGSHQVRHQVDIARAAEAEKLM